MLSSLRPIERAKPLLGTFVRIRVHGLAEPCAHQAIDLAFLEVDFIHHLMSFHEEDSDVSRLNREAHRRPVRVNARTYDVLRHACLLSAATDGAFDITVAPTLVARGVLPLPTDAPEPNPAATWRDIVLLPDRQVHFRQPLWIDLGGIAKGYAVDCAIAALSEAGASRASVNAGGDLRVLGNEPETIRLAIDDGESEAIPLIEIADGGLASSCGEMAGRAAAGNGPHVNTRGEQRHLPRQFVSVMAPRCVDADGLTKLVMARGACSMGVLTAFSAKAVVYDAQFGWREIRGAA